MLRFFIRELDYPDDLSSMGKCGRSVWCPECYSQETQGYISFGWVCHNCRFCWEWCEELVNCPNCGNWRNVENWHCGGCDIDFTEEDIVKYIPTK